MTRVAVVIGICALVGASGASAQEPSAPSMRVAWQEDEIVRGPAARAAGFEGDDRIGPYLRSLIQSHHDTLATPVR